MNLRSPLKVVLPGGSGVRAIDHLIARKEMDGVVNLAAPAPLPNREFMRVLREAWGSRIGLPSAKWMLEVGAVFLRTETELVLKSRRVIPGCLSTAGFKFQFPEWSIAARNLVELWKDERRRGDRGNVHAVAAGSRVHIQG
jgi:NAD dependent epimerase/dehydratase family enzyme